MKRFAVIGNPVTHSLSPIMFKKIFTDLALDADFCAQLLLSKELEEFTSEMRKGNLDGVSVTAPFKQNVIPFLDRLDEHAESIGAVNCIRRNRTELIGHNTDWTGFIRSLSGLDIRIGKNDFIILGAGGAARAVIYGLTLEKAKSITIINRTVEKAISLKEELSNLFPYQEIHTNFWDRMDDEILKKAVIINTTTVGMDPKDSHALMPKQNILTGQTAVDIVYAPIWTQFRKLHHEISGKTISGMPMLIYQGLASLDLWYGQPISEQIDPIELQQYLEIKNHE